MKRPSLIVIGLLVLLVVPSASATSVTARTSFYPMPLQPSGITYTSSFVNFDQQMGVTFGQNSSSLDYNVTAVAQADSDGYGPAYLLNGLVLASAGYFWYQVGLSYNWPGIECQTGGQYGTSVVCNMFVYAGFSISYEIWSPNALYDFNGITHFGSNPNDTVSLSMSIINGTISLGARDIQNNATWSSNGISCPAIYTRSDCLSSHGSPVFLGLSQAANAYGYFTGLMTEGYHVDSTPISTDSLYASSSSHYASVMWADVFNIADGAVVLANTTNVTQTALDRLNVLAFANLTQYSNTNLFVTGSLYNVPISLYSVNGTGGE